MTRPQLLAYIARMIHHPIIDLPPACLRTRDGSRQQEPGGFTMSGTIAPREVATQGAALGKAWRALASTVGACTYRNDETGKLAIANVGGTTVAITLDPWKAQPATEPARWTLAVTVHKLNGEVWEISTWETADTIDILTAACAFIGKHRPEVTA